MSPKMTHKKSTKKVLQIQCPFWRLTAPSLFYFHCVEKSHVNIQFNISILTYSMEKNNLLGLEEHTGKVNGERTISLSSILVNHFPA